jgi:hypothetical protein
MNLGTPRTREELQTARLTPAAGENRMRQTVTGAVAQAKGTCDQIQRIVNDIGFAALSTQLGANAGEIEASYNALRTLAVTLSPGLVIPDLNKAS